MTARSKGLPETRVITKYPVRVALNPFASTIGYTLPYIVSGSIIVSIVLGLPTGRTPIGMYDHVITECAREYRCFSDVTSFNLDEYVGAPAERLRISPAPGACEPAETGPARSWRTAYAVPPRKSRSRPDV